jgi:hypothetical protein
MVLDKNHTFKAYVLSEYDEVLRSEGTFTEPTTVTRVFDAVLEEFSCVSHRNHC